MLRRPADSPALQRLAAWLRRVGPGLSLAVALVCAPLVFFGCFDLTEGTRFGRSAAPEPATPVVPDRQVRVRLLGKAPRPSAELAVLSAYQIVDPANSAVIFPDNAPLAAAPVRPSGAGGLQLGSRIIPRGDILIQPERDAAIVVNGQTYRGELRIRRSGAGLLLINQLDVEAYLRGVLRGELPHSFHKESFCALAVAARTYVLYQKSHAPADRMYDVGDDEGSQMYLGVKGEDPAATSAVADTAGEILVYRDGDREQPFCTYYSSACGGLSQPVSNVKPADPLVPPLAGNVPCNDCSNARFYRWEPVKLSKAEVTRRLVARFPRMKSLGTIMELRPKATTKDGRIVRIDVIGSGGQSETLRGEDFRLALGGRIIKSTNFKIETQKDQFIFKDGKGFGHGMGLCQYGMDAKAKRGMNYRGILSIYYPRSTLKKAY